MYVLYIGYLDLVSLLDLESVHDERNQTNRTRTAMQLLNGWRRGEKERINDASTVGGVVCIAG